MGDGVLMEFASAVNAVTAPSSCSAGWRKRMRACRKRAISCCASASISATSSSRAAISTATASMSLRGWKAWPSRARSMSRDSVHDQVDRKLDSGFDDLGRRREEHRRAGPCLSRAERPHAASGNSRRAAAAGQALDRRAALHQHERRHRAGLLRRRLDRRSHHRLSKAPGLFVIARNSSFTYKDKAMDVRALARDLGVRYVLEGSARRAAGRIRINAQLIDAQRGRRPSVG